MFVDSHCHLDFPDLAAREDEILATMAANDVGTALCIGVKLEDFPRVLGLAEEVLWWAVRAEDGRGPATALSADTARHFRLGSATEVAELAERTAEDAVNV